MGLLVVEAATFVIPLVLAMATDVQRRFIVLLSLIPAVGFFYGWAQAEPQKNDWTPVFGFAVAGFLFLIACVGVGVGAAVRGALK